MRGRELAGTLIRPEVDILEMGIVAAKRTVGTPQRWFPMQLALGALAVYNLRLSDYTPVEEHPLGF